MHLLQMAMAGLPTLLGVTVAIVKGGRCACEWGASVLLRRGLAGSVRVDGDIGEKRMRGAGEILNLPEGEEFFCLLLYKRCINTVCCHAGRAHASRMLPPREVNPPHVKLLNFKAT
jgi:hypothetical protein